MSSVHQPDNSNYIYQLASPLFASVKDDFTRSENNFHIRLLQPTKSVEDSAQNCFNSFEFVTLQNLMCVLSQTITKSI